MTEELAARDGAARRAPKRDKTRMVADDIVTANSLATHLGMTRQNVARLTAEAVIEQRHDGRYDQTASRLRYIKHLRGEHRQSARSEADASHTRAKAELLQLRIAQKKCELMPVSEMNAFIDELVGLTLTTMSGMAARIGGSDLQLRRRVDQVVYETRVAMSQAATRMADAAGAAPLAEHS